MAELFGKATGVSNGRGGSMHLFDAAAHFMGGYAIVGGQIPLATGAAYALKYQQRDGVVICQMGDATTNIGAWHESLNLAALWQLPIIFLVINNGYGMGTTVAEGAAEPELYKRGCAFRMHGERVDGTDVLAMRDATARLRAAAQAGQPSILEAVSFRFRGHSVIDSDRYRNAEQVKQGRSAHDPLLAFSRTLSAAGLVDEAWLKEQAATVERTVAEAIAFAEQSPDPAIEELFDAMYATPVPNTPGRAEAAALAELLQGGR
jgi:pyruvate dehydrogenase E1 component alpha subunit